MIKNFVLILGLITLISCQTNRNGEKVSREIATGELVWRTFVKQFSQKSKMSEESIEKTMIQYFQKKSNSGKDGNYISLGITDDQAQKIKSLGDDLPYMPKVRKWGMENMDKIFPTVQKGILADVYEEVVVASRGVTNRYKITIANTANRRARQKQISPIRSISEKQEQLLGDIRGINDKTLETVLRKNLHTFNKRGMNSPTIQVNGQEIIESAILISRKTGKKAIGDGCEAFTKSASREVLEIKANVDLYRAKLIEARAYNKNNGRSFASVKDVPEELRLTQLEIDDATKEAFRKVLGYSEKDASAALKRLKGNTCKLY